jgi:hypothetical protein
MGAYTNALQEMFETRLRELIEDAPKGIDVADYLRHAVDELDNKHKTAMTKAETAKAPWTTDRKQTEGYFGLCPHCHCHDGYINVGREHWFVCDEHKVRWCVGANLFDSWREQTEDEQRRIYNERGIGEYAEIEPYQEPQPDHVDVPVIGGGRLPAMAGPAIDAPWDEMIPF